MVQKKQYADSELWDAYEANATVQARNDILEFYWPWISKMVDIRLSRHGLGHLAPEFYGRVAQRVIEQAIPRFDRSRGYRFKTYLYSHVFGAISDEMRSVDRLSRSHRKRVNLVRQSTEKLSHQFNRLPTGRELAAELGVPESSVIESLEESGLHGDWLDLAAPPELPHCHARLASSGGLQEPDFENLTRGLGARTKAMLWLHGIAGYTMKEVGGIVGISEARVSQCLTDARKFIQKHRNPSDYLADTYCTSHEITDVGPRHLPPANGGDR